MNDNRFLQGVPVEHVLARLAEAGGNEVGSGKFDSPESSAALAVNVFGWFIERPKQLPAFPGMMDVAAVTRVDVEYSARFPWSGGKHPWLDAIIESEEHLIGVESKRFEPFRGPKAGSLSEAYDRPVWGDAMGPFESMRDGLRTGSRRFEMLDAAQLVKHAFGLVTDAGRKKKRATLLYLFAEPTRMKDKAIESERFVRHRAEITEFAEAVDGAAVRFYASSYRDWLATWREDDPLLAAHRQAVLDRFAP